MTTDPRGFDELRILADVFHDAQRHRIALENRTRSGAIDPHVVSALTTAARSLEHQAKLAMVRCFRRVAPELRRWALDTPGIGEHLLARLLGATGDPAMAYPHRWDGTGTDRVLLTLEPRRRRVSDLWSYCGHGDPARRRRVGQSHDEAAAGGSPTAKMLTRLLAEACIKQVGAGPTPSEHHASRAGADSPSDRPPNALSEPMATAADGQPLDDVPRASAQPNVMTARRRSPYRDVYDEARERYVDRPEWTLGHQHNAALRLVGKTILRDLWVVAS